MSTDPFTPPPAARSPSPLFRHGSLGQRIGDLVLTTDRRQRRCLTVLFLTAGVTSVGLGLVAYGIAADIFAAGPVGVVATLAVLTTCSFYVAIRSGFNQRFAEPTLACPQAMAGQTLVAATYAVTGVVHAGCLVFLALVMVFGMFNMRVRSIRMVGAYTIMLMGAVMAWRAHTDPLAYPARLEWFYFVLVATVMTSVSKLSVQLTRMRERVKTQKVALERALAHIREMATRDELTGLANRRHMMYLLNEHAMRRSRGGPAFYIAMVDLDHFKAVNDTYGHAVGDEALRCFARKAQAVLRNTDIIGRWGGEEFLLLLPETPPGEPTIGIERLRACMAGTQFCSNTPALRVAFSSGFARYRDGERIDQTIERADRALYAAKSAGRNQTVVLDGSERAPAPAPTHAHADA